MWFEAHDTLSRHPKTLKLARILKVDRRYAVGLLHDLFSWGLYAAKKDGTLPGLDSDDIAAAMEWTKKQDVVGALVESGYMDTTENGEYRIHNWYEYAGRLADKRESDRERMRRLRSQKSG